MIIRQAKPSDVDDFLPLFYRTGESFFRDLLGKHSDRLISNLFKTKNNLFSYEHTLIAELDSRIRGMTLGYSYDVKVNQELRTGCLIARYLGFSFIKQIQPLLAANKITGYLSKGEFYSSNTAVRKGEEGKGIGTKLALSLEEIAYSSNSDKLVFDVETKNNRSIYFRSYLGFGIDGQSKSAMIGKNIYSFYRMSKALDCEIKSNS